MATFPYIILQNSDSSLIRRFKAIALKPGKHRTDNIETTLGGGTDKAVGPIVSIWEYVLRIPLDDPAVAEEGKWSEFDTLWSLNNPNATPSDQITLTDHFGNSHTVFFVGDQRPEPLTTMLEGDSAWYLIQVSFREVT